MQVRDEALKALEEARNSKLIGSALEAEVTIASPADTHAVLARHEKDLEAILIVSGVRLTTGEAIVANVTRAAGAKCERCWHYSTYVGKDPDFPTVCERCAPTLKEILR
jgi:isoleucyl-tRNA synthetase